MASEAFKQRLQFFQTASGSNSLQGSKESLNDTSQVRKSTGSLSNVPRNLQKSASGSLDELNRSSVIKGWQGSNGALNGGSQNHDAYNRFGGSNSRLKVGKSPLPPQTVGSYATTSNTAELSTSTATNHNAYHRFVSHGPKTASTLPAQAVGSYSAYSTKELSTSTATNHNAYHRFVGMGPKNLPVRHFHTPVANPTPAPVTGSISSSQSNSNITSSAKSNVSSAPSNQGAVGTVSMSLKERLSSYQSKIQSEEAPRPSIRGRESEVPRSSVSRRLSTNRMNPYTRESVSQPVEKLSRPSQISRDVSAFDVKSDLSEPIDVDLDEPMEVVADDAMHVDEEPVHHVIPKQEDLPRPAAIRDQAADDEAEAAKRRLRAAAAEANNKPKPASNIVSSNASNGQNLSDICETCQKKVYVVERQVVDNRVFHKTCFKCNHCKSTLKMGNFAALEGKYYCKPHFKQLFKLKGNYSEGFGKEDPKKAWIQ